MNIDNNLRQLLENETKIHLAKIRFLYQKLDRQPWYGRCDRAGFAGELKDREYGNSLAQGEKFEKSYTIAIEM